MCIYVYAHEHLNMPTTSGMVSHLRPFCQPDTTRLEVSSQEMGGTACRGNPTNAALYAIGGAASLLQRLLEAKQSIVVSRGCPRNTTGALPYGLPFSSHQEMTGHSSWVAKPKRFDTGSLSNSRLIWSDQFDTESTHSTICHTVGGVLRCTGNQRSFRDARSPRRL